jgi:mannan endo-1,4-beta-mannosidase
MQDLTRGLFLAISLTLLAGCGAATRTGEPAPSARPSPSAVHRPGFVQTRGPEFVLDGQPYAFVGANLWYGAYLGAGSDIGNVDRLRAELDLLRSLGVTNLRVLGASEAGPMKQSVKPAFRGPGDDYNQELLRGLDVLLSEMAARDMKAVIYLNNFWEWSGGMGTYLSWVNGGKFVDLGDPEQPWPAYPLFTMQFYENEAANALYRGYVQALVTRTNSVTAVRYVDDPTIMAWQLANEPRPGSDAGPGHNVFAAFYRWIDATAGFIKGLDAGHLVSTGSEGVVGCADQSSCFLRAHESNHVDYLTFHLWPKNWGWLSDADMPGTIERSMDRAARYVDQHLEQARALGKPLVLEEFGLPRDGASLQPGSATTFRDRFYAALFEQIERSTRAGGPLRGSNVWTWGGLGRAQHLDAKWRGGDSHYTGDPPQEPQGLNSIFDVDATTLDLLRTHARALQLAAQAAR